MPAPSTCLVSGVLYGPGAAALQGVVIKAYITSAFTDANGNYIPSGVLASTTSASDGTWSLAVIQTQGLGHSITFQFEYPLGNNQSRSVKYPAVIPATATANFADLVSLSTGTAALASAPTTDALPEGVTNLYFTNARARAAISAASPLTYSSSTGVMSMPALNTDNVVEGVTNLYFTSSRADARIALQRGANSGLASLDSGGKVPLAQLPASLMEYQGTWNATTNSPTLADGTGTSGFFYRVNVAGTQNLGSGSQTFVVGDWVMYNGAIWQLAHAGSDLVISVAGKAGAVTLASTDLTDASGLTLLGGRSGGQTLDGDTAASGNLTLSSTAHATKGKILFGASAYDEVNGRLGINLSGPTCALDIKGNATDTQPTIQLTASNGNGPTKIITTTGGAMLVQNNAKNIIQSDTVGHVSFAAGAANGPANLDTVIAQNVASDTTHNTFAAQGIASQTGDLFTGYASGSSTKLFSITIAGKGSFSNLQDNAFTSAGVVTNDASGNLASVAPSTSGNVLTSNGSSWVSSAATGGVLGLAGAMTQVHSTGWSLANSTSYGTFAATGSVSSSTATNGSTTASLPSTVVPGVKLASIAAGTYKVTATGRFGLGTGGNETSYFTINDGTNYGQSNGVLNLNAGSVDAAMGIISSYFTYGSTQTNIVFQIGAKGESGTGANTVCTSGPKELAIVVERIY